LRVKVLKHQFLERLGMDAVADGLPVLALVVAVSVKAMNPALAVTVGMRLIIDGIAVASTSADVAMQMLKRAAYGVLATTDVAFVQPSVNDGLQARIVSPSFLQPLREADFANLAGRARELLQFGLQVVVEHGDRL